MSELPFPVSARPRPDESLPGFLVRLARRVGAASVDRLAFMVPLRRAGCVTGEDDLGPLARMAGTEKAVLEGMAYRPSGRFAHHRFGNGTLHREIIDLTKRRYCAACLAAEGYHRADWDVTLLTACPTHSARLITTCDRCGDDQSWNHTDILRCGCGRDLRSAVPVCVPDSEAVAIQRLVDLARARSTGWLPPALAACDPADLVHLSMCLGMFMTGWIGERRVETLAAAGAVAVAEVMVSGIGALAAWPGPLLDYLASEQLKAGERAGRYGARKTIGPIYGWLQGMGAGPVRDAIVAVVRELPAGDPVLARRMHRSSIVGPSDPSGGRVIGLLEVAKILGCSQTGVKRMMARGVLPAVESLGRGVPMAFDQALVADVAARLSGLVDLRQACTLLGISKARVRLLIDANLLDGTTRSEEKWQIPRHAISGLIERLSHAAPGTGPSRDPVSFNHTVQVLRRRGVGIDGVVRLILEGGIAIAGTNPDAVGLHRLLFERDRIQACARGVVQADAMTRQSAAGHLGLKWEVVSHLMKVGLLGRAGGALTRSDVERFASEFVSGSRLAREAATSPRGLAGTLAGRGIIPVSGPDVDGGRQNFFRRSDLSRLC
jgi:predicted DNA-binding transcriptional regulator AlpA